MSVLASALREFSCRQSLLSQADGSASFQQGDTGALVAVYGPAECSKSSRECITSAYLDVVYKAKVGLPQPSHKLIEEVVRESCRSIVQGHRFPRSQLTICLQEVQDSGSLLSTLVNATCMALMDSGVPMGNLVASVTCAVGEANQYVIDPTGEEEEASEGVVVFVFDRDEQVVACSSRGCFTAQQHGECEAKARAACRHIFKLYTNEVSSKFQ